MAHYTVINVYILRIEIFEEIEWGNRGVSMQILDQSIISSYRFPQ